MIYLVFTLIALGGPFVAAMMAAREIRTTTPYVREIKPRDSLVKIDHNRVVVAGKWIFLGRTA